MEGQLLYLKVELVEEGGYIVAIGSASSLGNGGGGGGLGGTAVAAILVVRAVILEEWALTKF
jgi:hypothetical protein